MRPGALAFAALIAAAVLLAGCGGQANGPGEVLDLRHWTLEAPLGSRSVTLPATFDDLLPRARSRYALKTRIDVPPSFRGRALTLAIAFFPALAGLKANGHEAPALDATPFDRYRSEGPLRWRISAEETQAEHLDLELDVEHTWTESGWLNVTPTLSATPGGDERFLFISTFNRVATIGGFTSTLVVSLIYVVISMLDRRRTIHAWHSVQGLCGMLYPAFFLGALQPLFGTADLPITGISMTAGCVASVFFVASVFELPRPSGAWWLFVVAAVIAALVRGGPFEASQSIAPVVIPTLLAVSVYAVVRLVQRWKRGRPSLVEVVAGIAFPAIVLLSIPDAATLIGLPAPLGGLHGGCFAIGVVSLFHGVALSRTHSQSLHRADDLNAQLAARVALLESSNKEVVLLNDELRRQIAARSERLADALSRLGPMATPPRAFAAGDVIDARYRVIRRIGEGGMGMVYEIARVADGRRLALKVLHAPRSGGELARLAREAEIASRFDHPNVVRMVDVDVAPSGALYLVMEYVDGTSLDALRARYRETAWALPLLRQIAEGLAALHAEGIVHRDLKPGNVLVTSTPGGDVAKIADFGIATRLQSDATTTPRDDVARPLEHTTERSAGNALTRTGQILGTPVYMAPELVRGAKLATAASDVYAFGVIAWEALTGSLPDGFEVLLHLRSPGGMKLGAIGALLPALPPSLAELLDACLANDPAGRPTAATLAHALAASRGLEAQAQSAAS